MVHNQYDSFSMHFMFLNSLGSRLFPVLATARAQVRQVTPIALKTTLIASLSLCMTQVSATDDTGSTSTSNSNSTSNLPELGDAASAYLNKRQEEKIGKQFLRQLLASKNYVNDPELRYYINELGAKVGSTANLGGLQLHFNLLKEKTLNAFAVPGGYITFHTGLILTTETESELASVVGHEIAHLSQRHLPRMIAKAEASKLPSTAAILASLLIGGQVGVAGVTLANANLISNQLAYSREFEKEADAIGIQMMSNSGFDPQGTAAFFDKLQRFTLVTSTDVPEFLRSHPLSYTRVAEAESRLAALPKQSHSSSMDFHLSKAKIRALYSDRPEQAQRELIQQIEQSEGLEKVAAKYGLALSQVRQRRYNEAIGSLRKLVESYPDNAALTIGLSNALVESGNSAEGIQLLSDLSSKQVEKPYIAHYLLDALLGDSQYAEAKKLARYQLRRHPDDFRLFLQLSKANVGLDQLAEAHQADAEYLSAIGRYQTALASLKLALRDNGNNSSYLKQSIEARIEQIERITSKDKKS